MAGALGKLYLIAYNSACIAGWGYCLWLAFNAWKDGVSPTNLWVELELPLVVRRIFLGVMRGRGLITMCSYGQRSLIIPFRCLFLSLFATLLVLQPAP